MGSELTQFQVGHMAARKHGAQSPRVVAERTQLIVAELLDPEDGLQLTSPVDRHAVWATAAALARLEELTSYLEGRDEKGQIRGAVDSRGRPRGAMKLYFTAFNAVMAGLKQLGATPAGRTEMAGGISALQRRAAEGKRVQTALSERYGREAEA